MTTGFPFGILVVTDEAASDPIPCWSSPEEQVTASKSSVVLRVLHQQEGDVQVKVWRGSDDGHGALVFAGTIDVMSGVLTVCDALISQTIRVPVENGSHTIELYADSGVEASEVSILLDRADPDS